MDLYNKKIFFRKTLQRALNTQWCCNRDVLSFVIWNSGRYLQYQMHVNCITMLLQCVPWLMAPFPQVLLLIIWHLITESWVITKLIIVPENKHCIISFHTLNHRAESFILYQVTFNQFQVNQTSILIVFPQTILFVWFCVKDCFPLEKIKPYF